MKENKIDLFFSNISYPYAHNSIHAWGKLIHLKEVLTMTLTQLLHRFPAVLAEHPAPSRTGAFVLHYSTSSRAQVYAHALYDVFSLAPTEFKYPKSVPEKFLIS